MNLGPAAEGFPVTGDVKNQHGNILSYKADTPRHGPGQDGSLVSAKSEKYWS